MAKANDKTPLIIGGIALAAVAAAVLLKKKEEQPSYNVNPQPDQPAPQTVPVKATPQPSAPATIVLNKSLVLKNGSKGNEVKELQKLLGIIADGVFGPQTEGALYAKKGVKQITLVQFATIATVNANPLPIGTNVMAGKKPTFMTIAGEVADGSYYNTKESFGSIEYGKVIGKIKQISAPSKSHYVVEIKGFFSNDLVWVAATDVVKI